MENISYFCSQIKTRKVMSNIIRKVLLLAMTVTSISVMAQEKSDKPIFFPKLFHMNKAVSVGIIGATIDNFNYGAIGLNATFYGFYVDGMGWPRKHVNDVPIDQWQDHYQYAFHAGYQVPIHYYDGGSIRIIPLIGYAKVSEGITDGSDWDIINARIHNGYEPKFEKSGLDYGAALSLQNYDKKIGYYNFYLAYTRYTAWIGFGIEFSLRNLK